MIALVIHESRMITRRPIWPATLVLHAFVVSLFVGIWGPTGGVPLWEASTLHQLTAVERLASAVLLTWLATFVLTDDESGGRSVFEWSALTGQPAGRVQGARLALAAILALVFVAVAGPAFAAAGASSAASLTDVVTQAGIAAGFAVFVVGVTAVAGVALSDRVAVWCTAMVISIMAAAGVQTLDTMWHRVAAPALAGIILLILAPAGIRARIRRHAD